MTVKTKTYTRHPRICFFLLALHYSSSNYTLKHTLVYWNDWHFCSFPFEFSSYKSLGSVQYCQSKAHRFLKTFTMQVLVVFCIGLAVAFAAPDTSCSSQIRGLEDEMSELRKIFQTMSDEMEQMKVVVDDEGKFFKISTQFSYFV